MKTHSSVNDIGSPSIFPDEGEDQSAVLSEKRHFNWQKLTKILRWTGAILLLVSAFIFLCQGLAGLSSMDKYRTFLGFTTLLGGIGVFCGKKWKEDKGARTFLGLATAMVAANFAQLGALVFFQFNGSPAFLPNFFVLQFTDRAALFLTYAVAACILVPVTYFGFSALIRKQAVPLSMTYLLCCTSLLLPYRVEWAMALVLLFQSVALLVLEVRKLRHEMHMSTFDGWLVRGILLLPILIVVFRTILYPINYLFYSTCLAALGTTLFFFLPDYISSATGKKICNALSMFCFGGSWLFLARGLSLDFVSLRHYGLLINFLPCAALMIVFSFINSEDGSRKRMIGALLGLAACLLQLFTSGDLLSAFICLIVSVMLLVLGCAMEEKIPLLAAMVGLMAGLGKYIHYALQYYSLAPWLSLAIAGTIVVLLSSYIEKFRHRDSVRLRDLHHKLKTWN